MEHTETCLPGGQREGRLLSLQALRAYAFLGIFTFHNGLTALGAWGVSIFLVLSGFVMFYTHQNKDLGCSLAGNIRFSFRKINKLYALHILLGFFLLLTPLSGPPRVFSVEAYKEWIQAILLNVTLTQAWALRSGLYFSVNGVSWYLSVCCFLYFMFPYLLGIIKRYKTNRTAVLAILGTAALQLLVSVLVCHLRVPERISNNFFHWSTYICPLYRLGDFFVGCNLGYLFTHMPDKAKLPPAAASVLECLTVPLLIGVQMVYKGDIPSLSNEAFQYSLLYLPFSAAVVFLFALQKGVITRLSTNRVLIWLGDLSGYCFLFHQVVIRCFNFLADRLFGDRLPEWPTMIATFVITLVAAIVWREISTRAKKTLADRRSLPAGS